MQRLVLKQNQSQKLSPQQIQFIKLLQLSNTNIESEIKKELEENPALEEKENNQEGKDDIEIPNVENYTYSQKSNKRDSFNFSKESNISNTESFRENLLSQINFLHLNENEKIIANQIIGTLDNDGYLRRGIDSIIDDIAFSENIEFNTRDIKNVLTKIQSLEPPGIAARNLEECLILQINSKSELSKIEKIAIEILNDCFDDFKNKKYQRIYDRVNQDKKIINKAFDYITSLNPKPSGGVEDSEVTE